MKVVPHTCLEQCWRCHVVRHDLLSHHEHEMNEPDKEPAEKVAGSTTALLLHFMTLIISLCPEIVATRQKSDKLIQACDVLHGCLVNAECKLSI